MGASENLPDLVRNNKFDTKVEMVLNEIIQSEKKYVKTLNTIVEVSYRYQKHYTFFRNLFFGEKWKHIYFCLKINFQFFYSIELLFDSPIGTFEKHAHFNLFAHFSGFFFGHLLFTVI